MHGIHLQRALNGRTLLNFIKRNHRHILYYGAMAVLLCALAYAADIYRSENAQETLVLPSVELERGEDAAIKPMLSFPNGTLSIRGFHSEPAWNDALGQWEIHTARDYSLDGERVTALCDGIVADIGHDAGLGGYVEIQSGELLLRYASMRPEEALQIASTVKAGDLLGHADGSMLSEQYMQAHLHLEAEIGGEALDPGKIQ